MDTAFYPGTDERFWSKVKVGHPLECWEWTASTSKGYGKFKLDGTMVRAHRYAADALDSELCVLHRCDNPPCCNPSHLFLGTHADNARDRDAKGRHRAPNAGKTHCVNGHEFNEANTYVYGEDRYCRTCRRKTVRESMRRLKERQQGEQR